MYFTIKYGFRQMHFIILRKGLLFFFWDFLFLYVGIEFCQIFFYIIWEDISIFSFILLVWWIIVFDILKHINPTLNFWDKYQLATKNYYFYLSDLLIFCQGIFGYTFMKVVFIHTYNILVRFWYQSIPSSLIILGNVPSSFIIWNSFSMGENATVWKPAFPLG